MAVMLGPGIVPESLSTDEAQAPETDI